MIVLIISTYFNDCGGAEKAARMHTQLLRKNGHKVIELSFSPDTFSGIYSIKPSRIMDKCRIRSLSLYEKVKLLKSFFFNHKAVRELERAIHSERPDVIHLHRVKPFSPSIYMVLQRTGIPVFMTLHDHYLYCPSSTRLYGNREPCSLETCNYMTALRNKCVSNSLSFTFISLIEYSYRKWFSNDYSCINKFLSPSMFMKKQVISSGLSPSRVLFVPNYIEPVEPDIESGPDPNRVVFIGRLSVEKGIDTLLKAAHLLKGVSFWLVGDGPLHQSLQSEIAKRNLTNVELKGSLYGSELASCLMSSAVLVLPSECFENAPLVVLEAFAFGIPVIGSNRGGIPELVKHEINGLLFIPGDHHDLADKIHTLLHNRPLMHAISANNISEFQCKYTESVYYKNLMAVYGFRT